jgi:hypothetical protein
MRWWRRRRSWRHRIRTFVVVVDEVAAVVVIPTPLAEEEVGVVVVVPSVDDAVEAVHNTHTEQEAEQHTSSKNNHI